MRHLPAIGLSIALAVTAVMPGAPGTAEAAQVGLGAANTVAPPKGRVKKGIVDPSIQRSSRRKVYGRQAFKWFWNEVSTSRSAASPNRWAEVMQIIESGRSKGRAVFGSRATAARILRDYGPFLEKEAKRRNISVAFLIAVIAVESNGNSRARSPKGAGGLMQLMPPTAARFGVSDAYTPSQNIRGGAQYLDWLLKRFKGDAVLALAGYNAGEGAVGKYKGVPPFAETRDYVAKVAGAYAAARSLCKTAPINARDVCDPK
ncbi:MAG: lytic transglycosylase domain-containing protein [Pseudomonadota bacterium]